MRRGRFIVRVGEGTNTTTFKGQNIEEILDDIRDKYDRPRRPRRH